jgi:putative flippase GtrA
MMKLKDVLFILSPKLSIFKAPLRYFVVVVCGFSVDFLIYATLVAMGVSVYWANAAGFCVGAIFNVVLIRTFVFPESKFNLGRDLLLTVAVNGAMLGLGMSLLWILIDVIHINPYWAKLLTNGVTFVLNYITRAVFFRKK